MNAKVLLTALALGGAAVYAAKLLSRSKRGKELIDNGLGMIGRKNNRQRDSQAFSPVRTPTPPY